MTNFRGYDIAPDMVRLSRVNMYLHGFPNPVIHEYDALPSEERWDERCDVIMANPPFMTPKGGIRPHNRFSIKAKRSEVLFVDYIAEHLNPSGRAGVIVPEGIIFQSQNAYKALRKMLVENYLWAVVSLPAGVFNPYSGVKTSVLFLDRNLAKRADEVLFVKVENDGFDLGAQRRPIEGSDLPEGLKIIADFRLRIVDLREDSSGNQQSKINNPQFLSVPRAHLLESPDINLSGDRYRVAAVKHPGKWPMVKLGDACEIQRGASPRPIQNFITTDENGVNWIKIGDANEDAMYISSTEEKVTADGAAKSRWVNSGDLVLSNSMSFGRPYIMATRGCIHDGWLLLHPIGPEIRREYLYFILKSVQVRAQFERRATGGVVNNLNSELVRQVEIPLPPLDDQERIVADLEGYRRVIEGARQILASYKPIIRIDPAWPIMPLGDVITLQRGYDLPKTQFAKGDVPVVGSNGIIGYHDVGKEKGPGVVTGRSGTIGKVHFIDYEFYWPHNTALFVRDFKGNDAKFIMYLLQSIDLKSLGDNVAAVPSLDRKNAHRIPVPLPPLDVQRRIVAELEAERNLVEANRELIVRMETKIQAKLAEVWGQYDEAK
jgi:type I restriction enzyme M protein